MAIVLCARNRHVSNVDAVSVICIAYWPLLKLFQNDFEMVINSANLVFHTSAAVVLAFFSSTFTRGNKS